MVGEQVSAVKSFGMLMGLRTSYDSTVEDVELGPDIQFAMSGEMHGGGIGLKLLFSDLLKIRTEGFYMISLFNRSFDIKVGPFYEHSTSLEDDTVAGDHPARKINTVGGMVEAGYKFRLSDVVSLFASLGFSAGAAFDTHYTTEWVESGEYADLGEYGPAPILYPEANASTKTIPHFGTHFTLGLRFGY